MKVQLAAGAYDRPAYGLPEKVCENLYMEEAPVDPKRPVALFRTPGTVRRLTTAANVRGLFQADGHASGKILIPAGTAVRTLDPSTYAASSLTGTIAGTDRCDFAVSQSEAAVLANGSIYVSDGTNIAIATDVDFPASITSVASIGQRLLLSAADGRFWFTEVLDFDNITALSYYTAELFPDDLVAIRVVGSDILLLGTRTIEFWQQTGDADDPFSWQQGRAVSVGLLCRDSFANLDGIPYFVAHDRTVRRIRDGQTAEHVSNAGVAKWLETAVAADLVACTTSYHNHVFYVLSDGVKTFGFDAATSEWHRLRTGTDGFWQFGFMVAAGGKRFVASRAGLKVCESSHNYLSEDMADTSTMGTEIIRRASGYISVSKGEPELTSIRLDSSRGIGLETGQGEEPLASMRLSKRGNPNEFTNYRTLSLGRVGEYAKRVIWRRNGRARAPGCAVEFSISDPVDIVIQGVTVNED